MCVWLGGGVYHRGHITAADYDGLFPGLCESRVRGVKLWGFRAFCYYISAEAAGARDVG